MVSNLIINNNIFSRNNENLVVHDFVNGVGGSATHTGVVISQNILIFDSAPGVSLGFTGLPAFTINVQESESIDLDITGLVSFGNFFDITTSDSLEGDVTLTFHYDDTTPFDEGLLNVYFHDGASWVLVPKVSQDTDANTITVEVDHFTLFGLFVAPPPVDTTPSTEGTGGRGGTFVGTPAAAPTPTASPTPTPIEATPESAPTPGFFATITGAAIGALGTGGTIFVVLFIVLVVVLAVWATRKGKTQ